MTVEPRGVNAAPPSRYPPWCEAPVRAGRHRSRAPYPAARTGSICATRPLPDAPTAGYERRRCDLLGSSWIRRPWLCPRDSERAFCSFRISCSTSKRPKASSITGISTDLARTTGQVQGSVGYPHRSKACSSAAELLAGDAAADVEQMVLSVVQCVSDDGSRVDHLIFGVDSDHDLLVKCE